MLRPLDADGPPDREALRTFIALDKRQPDRTAECQRAACICSICSSVDLLPPARLRITSPLAEYVARRIQSAPRRCTCREVA